MNIVKLEFTREIPAPTRRIHKIRVSEELKKLLPGESVLLDRPTARCFVEWARRCKILVVQKTEEGGVRVHRLPDGFPRESANVPA